MDARFFCARVIGSRLDGCFFFVDASSTFLIDHDQYHYLHSVSLSFQKKYLPDTPLSLLFASLTFFNFFINCNVFSFFYFFPSLSFSFLFLLPLSLFNCSSSSFSSSSQERINANKQSSLDSLE